jgi:hypothetical protein
MLYQYVFMVCIADVWEMYVYAFKQFSIEKWVVW